MEKDINNVLPPDLLFSTLDHSDTEEQGELSHVKETLNVSSSQSTTSISELLQRDNQNSRQKYLQAQEEEEGESSASSSASSSMYSSSPLPYDQLDRYGFIKDHEPDEDEEDRKRRLDEREANRSIKWLDMLKDLHQIPVSEWPSRHAKFEERLAKGVPDCIRCQLWPILAQSRATLIPKNYRQLYLKISGYERQIDLDIERTLRDHVMFKIRFSSAQVSLFKLLVAYSNHDPEVGYCQGMSTIAAFLLLYLPEEDAFQAFCGVLQETRQLFITGFPKLFETFFVQERLMRKYLPRLHHHLSALNIGPSIYSTRWYLTLFLGFPVPLACRIWDLFLFYGFDILPCVAVAVLRLCERRLLGTEYEQCMQLLSRLGEESGEGMHAGQVVRIAVRLLQDCRSSEKHRGFTYYRELYRSSGKK